MSKKQQLRDWDRRWETPACSPVCCFDSLQRTQSTSASNNSSLTGVRGEKRWGGNLSHTQYTELVSCTFSLVRWYSVNLDAHRPDWEAFFNVSAAQRHLKRQEKPSRGGKKPSVSRQSDEELVPSYILWRETVPKSLPSSSSSLLRPTQTRRLAKSRQQTRTETAFTHLLWRPKSAWTQESRSRDEWETRPPLGPSSHWWKRSVEKLERQRFTG